MQTRKLILSIGCLIVAAAIGFMLARRRQDQANLNTPVVRTYKVASDRAEEIRASLSHLLALPAGEGGGGNAQVFGNGLILVRAPIGFQNGIGSMIDLLAKEESPDRKRVHVDYYVVLGQPRKSSNAAEFTTLGPVLNSIEKIDGASHFRILEHLASNSVTGEESVGEGAQLKVMSQVTATKDRMLVKLSLTSAYGKVKTNTEVQPGEYVILGQNAQLPKDGDGNVYYVIHAELLK